MTAQGRANRSSLRKLEARNNPSNRTDLNIPNNGTETGYVPADKSRGRILKVTGRSTPQSVAGGLEKSRLVQTGRACVGRPRVRMRSKICACVESPTVKHLCEQ